MDKAKFQYYLSQSLENICVIQCTLNCAEAKYIPSYFGEGKIISYDILMTEQQINDIVLDISISFRVEDTPWATINIKGTHLGVGFYANEDPDSLVWDKRVFKSLKEELVKLNIAANVKSAIEAICNAYNKSK